jgi:hypothetical protein
MYLYLEWIARKNGIGVETMKHYLINTSWKCQLTCSYCWVRKHINQIPELNSVTMRPLEDWVKAIQRDPPDIMDIGGGEPLSVPWTLDLIRTFPNIQWGLSTNGINNERIVELARYRIPQIININLSYHPEAARKYAWYDEQWKHEIQLLHNSGYWLSPNLEDNNENVVRSKWAIEWLESIGLHMVISPLCGGVKELAYRQDQALTCDAGVNFITVDPAGNAWPCLSSLNSYAWKETCLGNWLDDTIDLRKKPSPCHLYCVEYNVQYAQHESGDFWGIHARPWEGD